VRSTFFRSKQSPTCLWEPLTYPRYLHGSSTRYNRYFGAMATTIPEALEQGKLYSDGETYNFLKLPTSAASQTLELLLAQHQSPSSSSPPPFQAFMVDKDEITVMISSSTYDRCFKNAAPMTMDHQVGSISYRLITFDVVLAPTLVGFMAAVTRVLADANISVLPFAAYSRDHIFVSETDFEKAMSVLESLKDSTAVL